MRRPLIETALLLWFGIVSVKLFGLGYVFVGALAMVLLLKFDLIERHAQQNLAFSTSRQDFAVEAAVICIIVAIGALMFNVHENRIQILEQQSGHKELIGIVMHTNKDETLIEQAYIVNKSGHKIYVGRVKIKDAFESLPGTFVNLTGQVQPFKPARNPNGFSSRSYYLSKGVVLEMRSVSEVEEHGLYTAKNMGMQRALAFRLSQIKNKLGYMLCKGVESQIDTLYLASFASMLKGILIGKTTVLDESVITAFRTTGTAHILAVSGLHFATVYAGLHFFMKKIRLPQKVSALLILFSMVLFLLMTGVSISGMRAFTMIILHQLAQMLNRRYDLLNALGAAALVSILMSPYTVWNVGFQLSFWAVFSIGAFQKMIASNDALKKYELVLLPLAIQVGLSVLSISSFNRFYPYALLYNLPVLAMTPFVILFGFLSVLLSAIPLFSTSMAYICSGMLEALQILTQSVMFLPKNMVEVTSFSSLRVILFYMIIAMLCLSFSLRQRMVHVHISVVLLSLLFVLCVPMHTASVTVDFLDVGQGDATLVRQPDGPTILIDSGPAYTDLEQILLQEGVKHLDAFYLSHPDSDHISGMLNLSDHIKIDTIYYGLLSEKKDTLQALMDKRPDTDFVQLTRGSAIDWDGIEIQVLSPFPAMLENVVSANDMSLVLLVDVDGFEILFTGDIESEVEKTLARLNRSQNKPIDIDVLKVAHHGSKTSTDPVFLEAFKPEYGVIQVGRNWYGHPSDKTLKVLKKEDIQVFRNDQQGCIRLVIKNGEPIWKPWLTMQY